MEEGTISIFLLPAERRKKLPARGPHVSQWQPQDADGPSWAPLPFSLRKAEVPSLWTQGAEHITREKGVSRKGFISPEKQFDCTIKALLC